MFADAAGPHPLDMEVVIDPCAVQITGVMVPSVDRHLIEAHVTHFLGPNQTLMGRFNLDVPADDVDGRCLLLHSWWKACVCLCNR